MAPLHRSVESSVVGAGANLANLLEGILLLMSDTSSSFKEGIYHSEAHLDCAGEKVVEERGCDHRETEVEREGVEDKQDKVKVGKENGWDLDMTVAGDGRRAEGDRAEAGVAAIVDRDNPIGVALEEVFEEEEEDHGEDLDDSTFLEMLNVRYSKRKSKVEKS
jgi:hypothetical protein